MNPPQKPSSLNPGRRPLGILAIYIIQEGRLDVLVDLNYGVQSRTQCWLGPSTLDTVILTTEVQVGRLPVILIISQVSTVVCERVGAIQLGAADVCRLGDPLEHHRLGLVDVVGDVLTGRQGRDITQLGQDKFG